MQLEKFFRASLRVPFSSFVFVFAYDWFICWKALLNRQAIGRAKYVLSRRKLCWQLHVLIARGFAACLSSSRICDYIYLSITCARRVA